MGHPRHPDKRHILAESLSWGQDASRCELSSEVVHDKAAPDFTLTRCEVFRRSMPTKMRQDTPHYG